MKAPVQEPMVQTCSGGMRNSCWASLKIYLQGIGGDSEIFKNAFGRDLHSFLCAIQIAHDPGQTELDGIVINPTCQIKIFQILGGSSAQRIRWRNFWNCLDLLSVGRLQFHISWFSCVWVVFFSVLLGLLLGNPAAAHRSHQLRRFDPCGNCGCLPMPPRTVQPGDLLRGQNIQKTWNLYGRS